MWNQPLAILDVETTHSLPQFGRIIELGLLRIENGQVVKTISQLINPEQSIPANIKFLTGIDDSQVKDAPTFKDLAAHFYQEIDGCVLVGHNVSFDYNFLRKEFERHGLLWKAPSLCTLKLARHFYAHLEKHNLAALAQWLGLENVQHHRAYDDAWMVWQLLQRMARDKEVDEINEAFNKFIVYRREPKGLNLMSWDQIPDGPGVYILRDAAGVCLYCGHSRHMRDKVERLFEEPPDHSKRSEWLPLVKHIDWINCYGPMGAQIWCQHLIATLKPRFAVHARKSNPSGFVPRWPFENEKIIEEYDVLGQNKHVFCVNRWQLQSAMHVGPELREPLFFPQNEFDLFMARILQKFLARI